MSLLFVAILEKAFQAESKALIFYDGEETGE